MMSKKQKRDRNQIEMMTIDELVLKEHLDRKLDSALDFLFIYPLVEPLYSNLGRPSIDPVVLMRAL